MRLATWNVNSLRSRIDRVEAFLQRHDVDVLALQETKAREDQLPADGAAVAGLRRRGRRHQPVERRRDHQPGRARGRRRSASTACPPYGDPRRREARAIGAICGGVRVWSLYVPERAQARRPALRLQARLAGAAARRARRDWLDERHRAGRRLEHLPHRRGRLRHRPVREDHPRHAARAGRLPGRSSTTGRSTSARPHTPGPDVYTYWDYYRQRFERNRGLRIDFVLGSPSFAARVTGAFVDRDERAGKGAIRPRAGGRRPRRLTRHVVATCRWRPVIVGAWSILAPVPRPCWSGARPRRRSSAA